MKTYEVPFPSFWKQMVPQVRPSYSLAVLPPHLV